MKHNFIKSSAAMLFVFAGISALSTTDTVLATKASAPLKRVTINNPSGKKLQLWSNYQNGQVLSFMAKNNSKWNVAAEKTDNQGNLWYKVGQNEWLEARYTVEIKKKKTPAKETASRQPATAKPVTTSNQNQSAPTASAQGSSNNPSASDDIVALAKEQVGKPYSLGASGSDSFDCSSLVQYVYGQAAGIKLPRTTYDQVNMGSQVSMNQLQPGDLLFWGSTTSPYHVAIYVGNNQYVSAATPDQGVVLQTISSYFYPSIAKRIL